MSYHKNGPIHFFLAQQDNSALYGAKLSWTLGWDLGRLLSADLGDRSEETVIFMLQEHPILPYVPRTPRHMDEECG